MHLGKDEREPRGKLETRQEEKRKVHTCILYFLRGADLQNELLLYWRCSGDTKEGKSINAKTNSKGKCIIHNLLEKVKKYYIGTTLD